MIELIGDNDEIDDTDDDDNDADDDYDDDDDNDGNDDNYNEAEGCGRYSNLVPMVLSPVPHNEVRYLKWNPWFLLADTVHVHVDTVHVHVDTVHAHVDTVHVHVHGCKMYSLVYLLIIGSCPIKMTLPYDKDSVVSLHRLPRYYMTR